MPSTQGEKQAADQRLLRSTPDFQRLPNQIQDLILASPQATADFALFFGDGGSVITSQKIGLPYYSPEPPRIHLDSATYAAMLGPESEKYRYMQRAVFSTLAHEIGHHTENTSNRLFADNGTEEEYVRYRADLEAKATFNAFPIFAELEENDPSFQPDWRHVGYISEFEMPTLYNRWKAGESDIISVIAAKIPGTPYKLSNPPTDLDNDEVVTHRDAYIRDYREQRERIRNFQQRHMDAKSFHQSHDDATHELPMPQVRLDPRNPSHPDHSLYDTLRRQLPPQTSDEMVAHVMLQAKIGGVLNVGELDKVIVRDDRVFVMGVTPGFRTDVYLSQTPPPMHETFQRSEDFDRQQAQDHAQWLAQEAQLSQGRGMRYSL